MTFPFNTNLFWICSRYYSNEISLAAFVNDEKYFGNKESTIIGTFAPLLSSTIMTIALNFFTEEEALLETILDTTAEALGEQRRNCCTLMIKGYT